MLTWFLYLLAIAILIKIFVKLTSARCKTYTCMIGKTALITGGNSGLGLETALALASRGCRVIIADKDDCTKTQKKIIEETGNENIIVKKFDLTSLKSVRGLAEDINATEERLDVLINNAGSGRLGNAVTEDGLHIGMQVNYFGSFLLTHLLIGLLKKSSPSRIIFVSSILSFVDNLKSRNLNKTSNRPPTLLSDIYIYGNSKLCAIMAAQEFSKRLANTGITCNVLHPGFVNTPIFDKAFSKERFLMALIKVIINIGARTVEEGAQTHIYLSTAKELEKVSGKFFGNCSETFRPSKASDEEFCKEIWRMSEELVKLSPEEKLQKL